MEGLAVDQDQVYLQLLLDAIRMCANYRPKFGQGSKAGLTIEEFTHLYSADPFYNWFGLDSSLMYTAHRVAGGMTSIYRQIGIGSQWVFNKILQDTLGLSALDASWSYSVPGLALKERKLMLDGRIPVDAVRIDRKKTIIEWLSRAAEKLELEHGSATNLKGVVFEVRQGYKSKDSKRQNADVANASNAYAYQYIPVVALLSNQIDGDVAARYQRARWLLLRGTTIGTAIDSTYVFLRDIIGYDLAAFFARNSATLRTEIQIVLEKLLSEQ
jgi:hypothetical protein